MKKIVVLFMLLGLIMSCTEQERAKSFGGSAEIELPCGQMLYDITWKENDLWVDYIPQPVDYQPVTHTFKESSSWGIWEGTVKIVESKCQTSNTYDLEEQLRQIDVLLKPTPINKNSLSSRADRITDL